MATQQEVNKKYYSNHTIQYFYIIQHIESGKKYAGSRYKSHCNPEELLKPDGYWTSSDIVYDIIQNDGCDAFRIIEILTEFGDLTARKYEDKFLRINECRKSDDWINLPTNHPRKSKEPFILKAGNTAKELPSYEYLHECFTYNKEIGILTWKHRPLDHFDGNIQSYNKWNGRYAHKMVGNQINNPSRYLQVTINYKNYLAHRVIYKMDTGNDPIFMIDHINGNKSDNRLKNLRSANSVQNSCNSAMPSNNTSGYVGVRYRHEKWIATIRFQSKNYHLGTFDNIEDAIEARLAGELKYHGEFATQHRSEILDITACDPINKNTSGYIGIHVNEPRPKEAKLPYS